MVSSDTHIRAVTQLTLSSSVPLAGSDLRGHAFGTKAFIQGSIPTTTSLRQAVYWSGLRQEIYNALCLQKVPDIDLSCLHSRFSVPGPDDSDYDWANQAIAHCADVLLFCFGENHRSAATHSELKLKNAQWSETRPNSFDPYFVGSNPEIRDDLPDIRYSSACHGMCKSLPVLEN